MLVERAQQGDADAIDELLRKNHGRAFLYAMRMTKHVEDAADLVSQGFVRIHRAIDRFQADSSFSTWMYRILRNCFIDSRKKHRVLVVASLDSSMDLEGSLVYPQPIDESESPFEASTRRDFEEQVQTAVERLPINQRRLVLMFHSQQLTYNEMASLLEIPAGTIKSRLHRARVNLKGIINSDPNLSALALPN